MLQRVLPRASICMIDPADACTGIEDQLRFEALVADLSSQFVNFPANEVDREILDAQQRICECLGLELSALWQWAIANPDVMTLTHLYRPLGGPPVPERMSASDYLPWSLQQVRTGRLVRLDSIDEAPSGAERDVELWRHYGVRTILGIPLATGGSSAFGCLSFHSVRKPRAWEDRIVNRLLLLAQVFANALSRKTADQALRESEARASLAADAAGADLWILNVETGYYWITPKNRELLQFAEHVPVTFEDVLERVHAEDRERVRWIVAQVLKTGEEGSIDYRIVWCRGQGRSCGGA
jgi:PAS domain-containing protein